MSTYPTPHDDLTCPNVREVATLRKRVEELEGEARVLIGCPCLCHTGQYGEPHLDCRECVRGCATPSAIDHDHEWALWCEKWRAALDLVGNAQARAEKAERERDYEQDRMLVCSVCGQGYFMREAFDLHGCSDAY